MILSNFVVSSVPADGPVLYNPQTLDHARMTKLTLNMREFELSQFK